MIAYFAKVSAWVCCGYCDEKLLVETQDEVHCDQEDLDEFGERISDAVDDQIEADGWADGYCPECRAHYRKQIAAIERADDDL